MAKQLNWFLYGSEAYVQSKAYNNGFTIKQACMSSKAEEKNYANRPNDTELARLKETLKHVNKIVKIFEDTYPDYGVWVESGYRSKCVNQAVGGVDTSGHRVGGAVDLKVYRKKDKLTTNTYLKDNPHELLLLITAQYLNEFQCEFDELLREVKSNGYWIHLAIKGNNNQQRKNIRTITNEGARRLPANYMKWSYKNLQKLIDSIK